MARFYGKVGYGDKVENPPDSGIWIYEVTEYPYSGDVIRDTRQMQKADQVNDNVAVSNSISIVADKRAFENFLKIKYVRWMGELWTVPSVEVRAPRLILNLGSVYNGPTP